MQPANHKARHRRFCAGFTLVELMVIVVIVGILALIGTYSFRKYITSSKTSEATGMIATIKAAEEQYKEETFRYLSPSASLDDFTPANPKPGRMKMMWDSTNPTWGVLGVSSPSPLNFVYSCIAGAPGSTPPQPGGATSNIVVGNWPTGNYNANWYIVKAQADFDGDGRYTVFVSANFAADIYSNGYNL